MYFSRGVRDLVWMLFSRGGGILIGLAMQSALAWLLGPSGRGEYAVCLIFSTFSAVIFTLGLDWAVIYFIASNKKIFNAVFTLIVFYILFISLVMWPALSFVIKIPIKFFEQASPESLELSIVWASSLIGFSITTSVLRGLRSFSLLSVIIIAKLSFVLTVTVTLLLNTNLFVRAPILADLSGNYLTVIVIIFIIKYKWQWRPQVPGLKTFKAIFSYGLRTFSGSIGMVANLRVGTVLLAFYVSQSKLGFFAIAMAVLTQLGTVSDVLNSVIMPRISSSKYGRPELVVIVARVVSLFILILGGLIIVSAKWFVPLLFSERFNPSITLIWILFTGMWLRSVCKVLFAYFNGVNRPQVVSLIVFINIVLNVLFLLWFLPRWGIIGAAWATTVANVISSMVLLKYFAKVTQYNMTEIIFPQPNDIVLVKKLIFQSNFGKKKHSN